MQKSAVGLGYHFVVNTLVMAAEHRARGQRVIGRPGL